MQEKLFLEVKLNEQPIAMQRPRLAKGHVYNPQSHIKKIHSFIFNQIMLKTGKTITSNPLFIELIFAFRRVKSNKRKFMTSRPDTDNCIKHYLDAMSTIVYFDDSQVIQILAKKEYADKPYVIIKIYEAGK